MALRDSLLDLLSPAVSHAGFFLEDVQVVTPGKHRIITVIVDGDTSLNLDQVTTITRTVSELLDEAPFLGDAPFTLEVTSPGVDRPLTQPRHWKKNIDHLVRIVLNDGSEVKGRISAADENQVHLSEPERVLSYGDIKRALIEIEFKKKVR